MSKSNCLNQFYFDSELYPQRFQLKALPNTYFRGPQQHDDYIACVGASQTFGRHCSNSYPELLSRLINVLCINLGLGDATPLTFTHPVLLEVINNSQHCILQLMTARPCENFYWGQAKNIDGVYCSDVYYCDDDGENVFDDCNKLWERLIQDKPDEDFPNEDVAIIELIKNTRDTYVQNFLELIEQITVPITFLWISKRQFNYDIRLKPLHGIYGLYPHFITQPMVSKIIGDHHLVTCIDDFPSYYPDQVTLVKIAKRLHNQVAF